MLLSCTTENREVSSANTISPFFICFCSHLIAFCKLLLFFFLRSIIFSKFLEFSIINLISFWIGILLYHYLFCFHSFCFYETYFFLDLSTLYYTFWKSSQLTAFVLTIIIRSWLLHDINRKIPKNYYDGRIR